MILNRGQRCKTTSVDTGCKQNWSWNLFRHNVLWIVHCWYLCLIVLVMLKNSRQIPNIWISGLYPLDYKISNIYVFIISRFQIFVTYQLYSVLVTKRIFLLPDIHAINQPVFISNHGNFTLHTVTIVTALSCHSNCTQLP